MNVTVNDVLKAFAIYDKLKLKIEVENYICIGFGTKLFNELRGSMQIEKSLFIQVFKFDLL